MAGKIFINYGYTQALYQRLEDEFGSADLFMDVEGSIVAFGKGRHATYSPRQRQHWGCPSHSAHRAVPGVRARQSARPEIFDRAC